MRRKSAFYSLVFFLALSVSLLGVPQEKPSPEKIQKLTREVASNPFLPSALISSLSFFELTTTKGEQKARAQIGLDIGSWTAVLGLETPLSNEDEEVQPVSIDGLAKSSNLKLGIQKVFWNPRVNVKAFTNLRKDYKRFLTDRVRQAFDSGRGSREAILGLLAFLKDRQFIGNAAILEMDDEIGEFKKRIEECDWSFEKDRQKTQEIAARIIEKICRLSIGQFTYSVLSKEFQKRADEECFNWMGTPVIFGFSGSIGKRTFNVLTDPVALTSQEIDKQNTSFRLVLGLVLNDKSALSVSWQSDHFYEAGSPSTFQIPYKGSSIFVEKKLLAAAPEEKRESSLSIEYKRFISGSVGICPSFGSLWDRKELYFRIPVYFLNGQEKGDPTGLNGGFFVEWRSSRDEISFKNKNFNLGIFIGATLGGLSDILD